MSGRRDQVVGCESTIDLGGPYLCLQGPKMDPTFEHSLGPDLLKYNIVDTIRVKPYPMIG